MTDLRPAIIEARLQAEQHLAGYEQGTMSELFCEKYGRPPTEDESAAMAEELQRIRRNLRTGAARLRSA